ncbi:MAG: helix-turn-helix domain-containing protein [Clostridium sp.]
MQKEINYEEIGNRIRIERENFDMTREKLSELVNLSPYFLGQIERGERKMSINTLIKISE